MTGSVDASRPCPDSAELKAAFRITRKRTLRRSDGTVSVESIRYQVPQPWRHLREAWVRYARWDLGNVDLVDGRSGERLCTLYPLDKRANADGVRRRARPGADEGGDPRFQRLASIVVPRRAVARSPRRDRGERRSCPAPLAAVRRWAETHRAHAPTASRCGRTALR